MTLTAAKPAPTTSREVMARYPILTAHLICESLGYFSPVAAANAILAHIEHKSFACEWYLDMAAPRPPTSPSGTAQPARRLQDVGRQTISRAFADRRYHRGYMADLARGQGTGPPGNPARRRAAARLLVDAPVQPTHHGKDLP